MSLRILKLRARYYWQKICNFFGYCPCGMRVIFTTKGRAICPSCRRR